MVEKKKITGYNKMRVGDLPTQTQLKIQKEITPYSTNIIALGISNNMPTDTMLGSGVLIKLGNFHGILTANHVVQAQPYRTSIRLGFNIKTTNHHFSIPTKYTDSLIIGEPQKGKNSPDLAVIKLPENNIGYMKANKSFWNLEYYLNKYNNYEIENDVGVWALSGTPDILSKNTIPTHGFQESRGFLNIVGFSGIIKAWEENDFDYIEYPVAYDSESDTPITLGGMSGGGLWHVPLKKSKNGKITFENPFFSGIAFYQTAIKENERTIYCHGRKSIYEKTFQIIAEKQ